jgi:hypothetical protein
MSDLTSPTCDASVYFGWHRQVTRTINMRVKNSKLEMMHMAYALVPKVTGQDIYVFFKQSPFLVYTIRHRKRGQGHYGHKCQQPHGYFHSPCMVSPERIQKKYD